MKNKPDLSKVAALIPKAINLQEIAFGGFKVVYRAQIDETTEAIKLVRLPNDTEEIRDESLRRIQREINILRECDTPCLVKLGSIAPGSHVIGDDTYVLYSEEYLPGVSLRERVIEGCRPSAAELAEVGLCILSAITELTRKGVIHRDITPDNVMQTGLRDRPYVLLDLGIAFQVGGTPLTRDSAHIPGTLYYIAPEMLDTGFRHNLDSRADLYTLGLTLYEYASGKNPFKDRSDPQFTTLYRIKTITPESLRKLRSDLPKEFCDLVDQLMKKLPALRPSNMAVLAKRLERLK